MDLAMLPRFPGVVGKVIETLNQVVHGMGFLRLWEGMKERLPDSLVLVIPVMVVRLIGMILIMVQGVSCPIGGVGHRGRGIHNVRRRIHHVRREATAPWRLNHDDRIVMGRSRLRQESDPQNSCKDCHHGQQESHLMHSFPIHSTLAPWHTLFSDVFGALPACPLMISPAPSPDPPAGLQDPQSRPRA